MHYTLCDMIADLAQNAVEADAGRVTVEFIETESDIAFYIRDNGKGMSAETLERVKDPFYTDGTKHPGRKIGLGIPFLIQTAAETGGEWNITSREGEGTTVYGKFDLKNIDTPPIGDVTGLFRQILMMPDMCARSERCEIEIIRKRNRSETVPAGRFEYRISRSDLLGALGELQTAASLALLGDFLLSQERDLESEHEET
ncbi:ATP-binding protein [Treponema brennaborense]|uniref:Histidine kinase n=1 Tax=Treponema brennaborense (strain DSM 12168 / CIP 105900 / DD5/3) TaxID=906968 RepID=F4LMZ2_TREBD|nr:sensor histidine kinase [Treponema brennaborense]AEE15778.1 histidine kinase [Treponema brennaborense DSM 12168]